jgi:hypothetical protein
MPSARHSVTINRSAAEVFAFLADGKNDRRWRRGVLDLQRVSGQGVGTVYHQAIRGPGGRRIAADYRSRPMTTLKLIAFVSLPCPG